MIYPSTAYLIKKNKLKNLVLLKLSFFIFFVFGIFGIVQFNTYPNLSNLIYLGWDPHNNRLFSTLLDPNFSGLLLIFGILLGIQLAYAKEYVFYKWFHLSAIILLFISMLLTFSRSTYVSALLSFLLFFILLKKYVYVIIFCIVLFASITASQFLITKNESTNILRTSTIHLRIQSMKINSKLISINPLTGIGFNRIAEFKIQNTSLNPKIQTNNSIRGTDNSFLFVFITAGICGLLSLFYFIYCILKYENRHKKGQYDYLFFPFIIATILAVVSQSFFINSFFYPWVLMWLWFLLGIRHGSN
jgi:O-antigen ligase